MHLFRYIHRVVTEWHRLYTLIGEQDVVIGYTEGGL